MKSASRRTLWLAASAVVLLVGASAGAQAPSPPAAPAATQQSPSDATQALRDGVVVLERGGKVLALGTVLSGDGRILTALSPLGHGAELDARYADGSVSRVRLGHSERAWDLALLVPKTLRWKKGLKASRQSALQPGGSAHTFVLGPGKSLALGPTTVKAKTTVGAGRSELTGEALELASTFKLNEYGSPVIDGRGEVVAVVARPCTAPKGQNCAYAPYGVSVAALRAFLRTLPASAAPDTPWLGIVGSSADTGVARGLRISSVQPESPAAAAGLKLGPTQETSDILVAIDGEPVSTPEALSEALSRRALGQRVELLVFSGGRYRNVSLVLRASPERARAEQRKAPAPRVKADERD